ncbi:glutathione transferase GstA [Erwinia sp. MMLR14_017]|uniref:glutathione transferase GstA n=1 Tax=Erwinia sp. MMLR14_017 TaxID=3093842 RepID=UPI00298F8C15|nr:glutathione transferase GstA [Erwinia sp. MMLR14_017]MDW8848080.1 glutathione transferase GstA [Erwinia sp. MMLR14_017]
MKLYLTSGACSLSPHIVLHESGLDFTVVSVDLKSKKTEQNGDFLAINPQGKVPALELDDGTILSETVAIVQYIADQKPDRQLLAPTGCMTRYQTLEWLNFIATALHEHFYALYRSGVPEEYRTQVREQLQSKFRRVNDALEGKQWLMGQHFTVADAYLFTVMRWAKAVKLDLTGLDTLTTWFERAAERPAVAAALQAEGVQG